MNNCLVIIYVNKNIVIHSAIKAFAWDGSTTVHLTRALYLQTRGKVIGSCPVKHRRYLSHCLRIYIDKGFQIIPFQADTLKWLLINGEWNKGNKEVYTKDILEDIDISLHLRAAHMGPTL